MVATTNDLPRPVPTVLAVATFLKNSLRLTLDGRKSTGVRANTDTGP